MANRQNNEEMPQQAQQQQLALLAQIATVLVGVGNNMEALQQRMQNENQNAGGQGIRSLDEFCRRNPKEFAGGFAPDEAQAWVANLERIFGGMGQCSDEQKVSFAGYMLTGEAADWWQFAQAGVVREGGVITWNQFKETFLRKYFPEDLKTAKEMEFLRLEQGNMTVGEYAAKFESLVKFMPYYGEAVNERSKCAKFLEGLKMDIKNAVAPLQITNFQDLVIRGRVVEEGLKAKSAMMKTSASGSNSGPTRNFSGNRGFESGIRFQGPYGQGGGRRDARFNGRREQRRFNGENRNQFSNQNQNNNNNYNKWSQLRGNNNNNNGNNPDGNRVGNINNGDNNNSSNAQNDGNDGRGQGGVPPLCNRCNRHHYGSRCPYENPNCFNCNQPGHLARNCQEPKREINHIGVAKPQWNGKVFTMIGEDDAYDPNRV